MTKHIVTQLFFLLQAFLAHAIHIPAENDTLNYRLVVFSVPEINGADDYKLEVAKGYFNDERLFKKNIILTARDSASHFIKLLPFFAQVYTWRITPLHNKQAIGYPVLQHFSTGYIPYIDNTRYRLLVLSNKMANKDKYIFLDNTRTMCDLDGNMVWFLPNIPGIVDSNTTVRDMHISSQGTICFLTSKSGYEISYDGKLLWSAPDDGKVSKDTSEFYHHQFTRLKSGNYLIAGNEYIERMIPDNIDTSNLHSRADIVSKEGKYFARIQCGTLIEYDTAKNIRWVWHGGDHLNESDFFSRRSRRGAYNSSTHLNSFFFDEDNRVVYTSFRDLSRIVKIRYPQGDIISVYGTLLAADQRQGNDLFLSQHNVTKDSNGNILLYNNNLIEKERGFTNSYILELKEPLSSSESLTKTWEFACNIDTLADAFSTSGGSVSKLEDGSFLASMGGTNRIFIVNREKEVLWNVLCERKDIYTAGQPWVIQNGYKASAVPSALLSKMLFNRTIH